SHCRDFKFISIVREAFVTPVTCASRPVRFQISHVSIFPNNNSPRLALARASSTLSKIHLIFGPEKYVASGKPVFFLKRSCPPDFANFEQIASVRVSCQTIAL